MLTKWDPFRELRSVEEEFDRMVGQRLARTAWVPPLDVRETEATFAVTVDLPGLEPDQVEVTFEDGLLTIRGQREFTKEVDEEQYHRIERSYGSFVRCFSLPETVDADKVGAAYKNGVLTISMPKKEVAKPRSIKVKIAE